MTAIESLNPRFFVAFLPPPEVDAFARAVIQELGDRYHTRTAKAPPHITLQPPFEWPLDALPALAKSLQSFAQTGTHTPIQLAGFGAFSQRVLYIKVLKTPELLDLQASLMQHLEDTLGIVDLKNKRRGFSPHMTVASRNLYPDTFHRAWEELQPREVNFEFVGDRLTLLVHRGYHWEHQQDFPLMG